MKRIIGAITLSLIVLAVFYPSVSEGFVERRFKYEPKDVLTASKFVKKGRYWEGYDKDNKLVGYVFLSMDWTPNLRGYSSKPLETLIGMDRYGVITGVKIIAYSEPIFMIGIQDSDYAKFLKQYIGKNTKDSLTVGKEISMDAISGATVTALVQNATVLGSARGVTAAAGGKRRAVKGPLAAKKPVAAVSDKYEPLTWDALVGSGALKNITVTNRQIGMKGDDVYVDLYFGVVTPPSVGRNILGERFYKETMKNTKKGESALVIVAKTGSFKGTGFAYGGIFSTIEVEQAGSMFIFTTEEYENLSALYAKGAPGIREGGVFIVRGKDPFDQTMPFNLNLILPYYTGGKKTYKSFSQEYRLPATFLKQ